MIKTLKDFINSTKNVKGKRNHEVKNSYGVVDAYKFLTKRKWNDIGQHISQSEFSHIVRLMNKYLGDSLIAGNDVRLPHKMGRLALMKYSKDIKFIDGKLVSNLPVDWDKTLKLWYEDEEAYKNKTLVRATADNIFRIYYNKIAATFPNKMFYEFRANRELKARLIQKIKDGAVDAFMCGTY